MFSRGSASIPRWGPHRSFWKAVPLEPVKRPAVCGVAGSGLGQPGIRAVQGPTSGSPPADPPQVLAANARSPASILTIYLCLVMRLRSPCLHLRGCISVTGKPGLTYARLLRLVGPSLPGVCRTPRRGRGDWPLRWSALGVRDACAARAVSTVSKPFEVFQVLKHHRRVANKHTIRKK